ncbi:MAG: hypothetical protein ACKOOL_08890 [Novosphingobium sp.]
MRRILLVTAMSALALAACSKSKEPDAVKTDPALAEASGQIATDSPPSEPSTSATGSGADQAEKSIPMAMRGRWGLVAADCTTARGDEKGLMTIDATSIRFYESIAKLDHVDQRSETALKANWAYSGEGMDWKRDMTLALQPGGKVLIKQEFGEDAPAGPYKYTRCE